MMSVHKFGLLFSVLFIGLTNSFEFLLNPLAEKKYVILDTDMAFDDAMAMKIILKAEKYFDNIKILAITIARGNATMVDSIKNTYSILHELNRTDIPIYRGEIDALSPDAPAVGSFKKKEGLPGDPDVFNRDFYPKNVDEVIQPQTAIQIIRDLIVANRMRISLLGLGPLTNIAKAIETYPEIRNKVREIFIMGGTINGFGNKADCVDFNFQWDFTASNIVLNKLNCPQIFLPWEGCIGEKIQFPKVELSGPFSKLKRYVTKCKNVTLLSAEKDFCDVDNYQLTPCDAFLAAAILFPQYTVSTEIEVRECGECGKFKNTIIARLNENTYNIATNWASN